MLQKRKRYLLHSSLYNELFRCVPYLKQQKQSVKYNFKLLKRFLETILFLRLMKKIK